MMKYTVYNLSKDNLVLDNVEIADSFFSRLRGLLGRRVLDGGEGLIIRPCNSIHTIGMKFPIDVAFIDKNDTVIFIMSNIPKGKLSPIVKGAKYVIEANANEYESKGLDIGDVIQINVKGSVKNR